MIEFHLDVDVLGNARFAFSPLAELGSSLRLLGQPRPAHLHTPWLRQVRPRLSEVDIDLLLAMAPPGRWAPEFLFPLATGPQTTLESQLQTLTTTAAETLRESLTKVWEGGDLPGRARDLLAAGPRAPAILAEALWEYWDVAIAPYWSRMCGVLEGDVSHRAAMSLNEGLLGLLADLHPEVTLHGHTMRIDKPHHADATYEGSRLTLLPSVFVWPNLIIGHSSPGAFELTYAARGVGRVWEDVEGVARTGDTLGALLGRTRGTILAMVAVPMSTTQIAHTLGQSPGSINQHLSVLRDGGMVRSWRSGRSVLYQQSALGTSLVAVNRPTDTGVRREGE